MNDPVLEAFANHDQSIFQNISLSGYWCFPLLLWVCSSVGTSVCRVISSLNLAPNDNFSNLSSGCDVSRSLQHLPRVGRACPLWPGRRPTVQHRVPLLLCRWLPPEGTGSQDVLRQWLLGQPSKHPMPRWVLINCGCASSLDFNLHVGTKTRHVLHLPLMSCWKCSRNFIRRECPQLNM